jgi:hypothetical protein
VKDGIYPDLDTKALRGTPGLSASGAKLILSSPAKYRHSRTHDKPTQAKDFGTAWHTAVLGAGGEILIADCATRGAKAYKDLDTQENRDADKTPILATEYETIQAMAAVLREHQLAANLLSDGLPEAGFIATDPTTGVQLRGRLDYLTAYQDRPTIVEAKTAISADPREFARAAYNLGYHIGFSFYTTCYAQITGEMPAMLHVVQEKEPPYLVSVCEFDADAYSAGLADMRRAIDIYKHCADTDTWPGYPPGINTIGLPPWAARRINEGTAA